MLPLLVAAFTAGLVAGSWVPYLPLAVFCLLILTALGCAFAERAQPAGARRTMLLYCCLLLGMMYWSWTVERPVRTHGSWREPGTAQDVSGRIVEPVQQAPDRFTMMVEPDITGTGMPRLIRLTWRGPEWAVFQGDRIQFRAKVRLPSGSLNPGGFDYAAYLERQGVGAVATVTGPHAVALLESGRSAWRWKMWNQLDRWRGAIRTAAIQHLAQPALGVYLGIILGDRGYLDVDVRDRFMVSGTVHLLSISGSHLGLVAILTFTIVRRLLVHSPADWLLSLSRIVTPTRLAALVTVCPVTLYACLAGAEIATLRSLLMVLIALLARWLGYEQRIYHALAFAAAIILLQDPRAIYDVSFQLSFVSVWAIAAWLSRPTDDDHREPDRGVFQKGLRWSRDAVAMSAVITLTTLPLVALYFNQFPWLGIISNLIAVPVMGLLLVPLGLVAAVWPLINGTAVLPLASSLQWLIEIFIKGLSLLAAVPGGQWYVAAPYVPLIVIFYGLLSLCWMTGRSIELRWCAGIAVAGLVLWWGWSPRLGLGDHQFRVMFLDVAQGDSTVLELPGGQVVLIDGGATYERFDMGRGVVGPYLWNRGIRSIDHVIATHPQLDHVGGLAWVIEHFDVGHYWGLGVARDETFYHRLEKALADRGLPEETAWAGQTIVFPGSCRLRIENPPDPADPALRTVAARNAGHGLNNRSIVSRLICGGHTVLLPADIEQEALSRLLQAHPEPVELLKVPHHGAASSFSREWISTLRPHDAVISAGRHNPYGHPAPAVLRTYESEGIAIWRTDRDGGIWATGTTGEPALRIHTTRSEGIRPVEPDSWWISEWANWRRLGRQCLQRISVA